MSRVLRIKKMEARRVFYIFSAWNAFCFALAFAVNMIYQVQVVGLGPLELVLVGTTLEVAVFLFEIPTGVVADMYSRRLSIIIGVGLIGLGFTLEGMIPTFAAVLGAQMLWGVGYTFTSGATEAWIVDEVGEAQVGQLFMRSSQLGRMAGITGVILGFIAATAGLNVPIVLGGMSFMALAVFLALFMPETQFNPVTDEARTTWQSMKGTFREGFGVVRGHTLLLLIVGIGVFYGLYSEGVDRLWTAHFLDNFTFPAWGGMSQLAWFAAFDIIGMVLGIAVTEVIRRRIDATKHTEAVRALTIISALMMMSLVVFALAGSFMLAVAAWMAFGVVRGLVGPIFSAWSNQLIPSNVRATVLSMFGQVDAIGQIAGGPPVGLVGGLFGVRAALMCSALILSPALLLLARARRLGENMLVGEVEAALPEVV